ncbi:hypothetical protein ENBRE01_0203 [Enteropsectra breve]|nr:hypothetical protein ENBRE01_0203 [Enteropsectra breve]
MGSLTIYYLGNTCLSLILMPTVLRGLGLIAAFMYTTVAISLSSFIFWLKQNKVNDDLQSNPDGTEMVPLSEAQNVSRLPNMYSSQESTAICIAEEASKDTEVIEKTKTKKIFHYILSLIMIVESLLIAVLLYDIAFRMLGIMELDVQNKIVHFADDLKDQLPKFLSFSLQAVLSNFILASLVILANVSVSARRIATGASLFGTFIFILKVLCSLTDEMFSEILMPSTSQMFPFSFVILLLLYSAPVTIDSPKAKDPVYSTLKIAGLNTICMLVQLFIIGPFTTAMSTDSDILASLFQSINEDSFLLLCFGCLSLAFTNGVAFYIEKAVSCLTRPLGEQNILRNSIEEKTFKFKAKKCI